MHMELLSPMYIQPQIKKEGSRLNLSRGTLISEQNLSSFDAVKNLNILEFADQCTLW